MMEIITHHSGNFVKVFPPLVMATTAKAIVDNQLSFRHLNCHGSQIVATALCKALQDSLMKR